MYYHRQQNEKKLFKRSYAGKAEVPLGMESKSFRFMKCHIVTLLAVYISESTMICYHQRNHLSENQTEKAEIQLEWICKSFLLRKVHINKEEMGKIHRLCEMLSFSNSTKDWKRMSDQVSKTWQV